MANKKITLKNKAGEKLYPSTIMEQVVGINEALDAKLPLSGGTLTGEITAPSFKTNLTSSVAEAVMAYPINISWGNDLNGDTYLKAGMYQMSSKSSTLNQPSATGYGNVITVNSDTETDKTNAGQIYLDSNGVSSKAYIRAGQVLSEAQAGYHITDKPWREVRFMDDLVTTSHIADAAITPAKIQTSIALNGTPSMTVEPTTSSPDKTIASVGLVKEVMEDIEIGGRNLVVNSSTPISSTAYFIGNLSLYENLIENSVYTITIWGELGADRTSFYLYPEWGMGGALCELQQVSNGVYNATFIFHKGDATNSNAVGLYQMPSAGTSTSTIERIKIEKGNKATDWTPAPEDVQAQIDGKLPLSGGTLTGDLTAPSFKKNLSSGVAEAVMTYPSSFAREQDLNSETFLNAGIYRLGSNTDTANQPGGRGYGNVLSIRGYNGDNAAQMFFDYFDNGKAYIRTGSTNPNAAEGFYLAEREWQQIAFQSDVNNAENRSKAHAEDYTDAEITKIENGETVAQKANSLYDEDSGDWKIWKDVTNAVGDEVEEVLKQNNFATKDDIQSIIPSNATETGSGIVRAATQAEVNDGHVSDNDPSEMAFVRPETLQSKLSNYPTTTAMTQAISESKEEVKGVVSAMDFPIEQVQGLKEALDEKLPLSGGTLTGNIKAPAFRTTLTSGEAEAVMAYPVNISWSNDLNSDTYLKAGMYQMSSKSSTLNQPSATGYGNVITVNSDTGTNKTNAGQIYLDSDGISSKAYIRAGQVLSEAAAGYHITDKTWREVRFIDELVTTSHIATAAITPAKIQTSIALNGTPSMTVEPTTSSPDKTIASVGLAKQLVEDIEIGGRNLILNSDFSKGVSYWNPLSDYSTVIFNVEENIASFTLGVSDATVLQTSAILFEVGQVYTVSFDCRSDEYTALDYCYFIGQEGQGNKSLSPYIYGITSEWKHIVYTFTSEISGLYRFGFGANRNRNTAGSFQLRNVKIEKGNKATDWSPAPEDINTEISNAENRSKSHAEDYTDAEITKIENGETVAQKANSLYDEDSGDWKIWKDVTNAVGDEVEEVLKQNNFATKDDIQSIIPSNATETGAGIVRAATQAEVNEGHVSDNDPSEMAFVRPETLENYIDSKGFATTSDISSAVASAKPAIFFQAAQPAGGKDGDIWIIP